MKVTLVGLCLLGVFLTVDANCNAALCSLSGSITGTQGCTTYQVYINCLTTQRSTCTSSAADTIASASMLATINVNTGLRAALNCNGATGLAFSVAALVLSAVASFFKL